MRIINNRDHLQKRGKSYRHVQTTVQKISAFISADKYLSASQSGHTFGTMFTSFTKHDAWLYIITKYEISFLALAISCTPGRGNINAAFCVPFPFLCQAKRLLNKLCRLA